jgi:hypothetical protein
VHHRPFIIAAACALAAQAAGAQTVWRCGNSYSQQPCPGGSAVSAADTRTPAEAQRASSVAQADMKLADKMEKERLAREKNAPKALVIGGIPAPAPAPAPVAGSGKDKAEKSGAPQVFRAVSPRPAGDRKTTKKKKKAS